VAQTRRRRQTKHRGNAAGVVVARGRTGRKPTAAEKSESGRTEAEKRERRLERLNRPPTWRNAFTRALIAAVAVLVLGLTLLKMNAKEVATLFPLVLLIYVPVSYYTDLAIYRRRMRKQEAGSSGDRERR
jgi:anti-sigma-K factor RskA